MAGWMQAGASGLSRKLCYRPVMLNMVSSKSLLLTAGIFCLGLLGACSSEQPENLESDELSDSNETRQPLPIVEAPFNRTRLLFTVARAASSHSVGVDDTEVQRTLDGKRFEVRLRFGCDGQGPGRGDHAWSVDPDGQTLRVRVVPTLSLNEELIRSVAGKDAEAAEGFWLPRPWLLNAACPAAQPSLRGGVTEPQITNDTEQVLPPPDLPAPAAQRIGIVQFFAPEDSRTGRRMDRPFESVKQLKDADQIGGQGFNLVLAGRLRARGDGRVILCVGNGRDRPPDCVVSADFDRVWIEQPEDKAVVAEWHV